MTQTPTFHFISGLPRSGSTLLSALLRQNPDFSAGVTSPVAMLCGNLLHSMSGATEFASFFSDKKRQDILRSVIKAYYADRSNPIIFDTNRNWTAWMSLVASLYPNAKVICCVRPVANIINSVEQLTRRNILQPSRIFNYKAGGSIYSRVEILMDPEKGLIGLPWSALREAWFGAFSNKLIVLDYDNFVLNPKIAMEELYKTLNIETFSHDFENIEFDEANYDADIGLPGLHRVHKEVAPRRQESCIPPDVLSKYQNVNFWLNPNLNTRGVRVI